MTGRRLKAGKKCEFLKIANHILYYITRTYPCYLPLLSYTNLSFRPPSSKSKLKISIMQKNCIQTHRIFYQEHATSACPDSSIIFSCSYSLFVPEDMLSSGCIYQRSYKLLPPGNKRLIWLIFYNDSSRSASTTRHTCNTTKLRPLSQTNKPGNFKPMPLLFIYFSYLALWATAIYCYIKTDFFKLFFIMYLFFYLLFSLFLRQ